MSQKKTNPATAALVFASLLSAAVQPPPLSEITSSPGQSSVTQQTQRTDNTNQGQRAPTGQAQQQFADDPNKTLFHTRRNIMRRLRRYMEKQGLIKGPRQWRRLLTQARRNLKDAEYQALPNAD